MTTGHSVLAKMRWRWFGLALLLWLIDQAVKYQTWHWPAFNIADICISLAALILILGELLNRRGPVQSGKSRAI